MSSERQTMMFSATFPKEIQRLAADFLHNYIWVCVGRVGGAADTVEQQIVKVAEQEKNQKLFEILQNHPNELTLVFVAKKRTASWLCSFMRRGGIANCAEIHGDLSQSERERALSAFRNRQVQILVATDVAARGLDIPSVSLVINYDLPMSIDDYVHRIGRTGRIGHKGKAIALYVSARDDPMNGNGNILKDLVELLENGAQSTVPDFLMEEYNDKFNPPRGTRFMPGQFGMGGRDVRNGNYGAQRGKGKGGFNKVNAPRVNSGGFY